jgi:hypothetical protein
MNLERRSKADLNRLWLLAPAVFGLLLGGATHPALGFVAAQAPEAVVRTYENSINSRSVDGLLSTTADNLDVRLFSADGTLQHEEFRSRAQQRNSFEHMLRVNPDSRNHILSLIASGPVVIIRDEAAGLPGGASEVGLSAFRVIDGHITQIWILNSEGITHGKRSAP